MLAHDPEDDRIPAIGYIRVSMAREEMISPELQKASIEVWAERRRRRIVEWVVDLDATGRNFKRKIMKAIGLIEDGTAKEIAVWKYSRFGRNRMGIELNLARIEKADGQLQSATEEIDATTATGWFQRDVIFSVAAFESKRAGEQWKETHDWRRSNGLPSAGGHRFGYIWHPRKIAGPDGTVTLQRERYEHDPQTAPIVAELYQRYIDGTGFDLLAKELNAAGIRTLRGFKWWGETLRWYMDSGFPAGYLRVHSPDCRCDPYLAACPNHNLVKVEPAPGTDTPLPPIINEETWAAYTAKRALIKATPPRARQVTMPFSGGLARCAHCDGAMIKGTVGIYTYLRCNNRRRQGVDRCPGVNIPYGVAERLLLDWMKQIVDEIDEGVSDVVLPDPGLGEARQKQAQLGRLRKEHERLEKAAVKHMRAYALNEDDDADGALAEEYQATLTWLRQEKTRVGRELLELEGEQAGIQARQDVRSAAMPEVLGLVEEWPTLPPQRINSMLRKVIRCVRIESADRVTPVPVWE